MKLTLTEDDLPLQCIYRWERLRANRVFLTQPHSRGKVRDWTWAQAVDEVRRIASHLRAQNWPPGTKVGILSKNCAWWMMADMAIWMAGHVTVPVYPSLKAVTVRRILEHSECRACFIGATDDKESSELGVPPNVHRISFPTAPQPGDREWEYLVRTVDPIPDSPVRPADDLCTIIYTSGRGSSPGGDNCH